MNDKLLKCGMLGLTLTTLSYPLHIIIMIFENWDAFNRGWLLWDAKWTCLVWALTSFICGIILLTIIILNLRKIRR